MNKFSKADFEIFRKKSKTDTSLIQLDQSNLFVSPTKLFQGKEIPKVSDSKSNLKEKNSEEKEKEKTSSFFFKYTKNSEKIQQNNHSVKSFENLSKPKDNLKIQKEHSLLGKRPFSSTTSPIEDNNVTKKLSTTSYFLNQSPISKSKQFSKNLKQGKERIPSRKVSPSKISSLIKRNKIKREEIENDSSLMSTLNTNLDYKIKFEGGELPKIRKKVCRKLYEIFSKKYGLGKKEAKHIALNVEYRMDTTFSHHVDEKIYKKNFKVLLKFLEV